MENLNNIPNFEKVSKITEIGDTGLLIDIYGTKQVQGLKNKLISLRADIDGLPFQETSNHEYKSIHDGMIHGCGHDGHIVGLVATINYYVSHLDKVPQTFGIRFLFQPAEEGLGGALVMIKCGCLENVSDIYGLHNIPLFNVGEIGVIASTIMAGSTGFDLKINGKGGHGSVPYLCRNPINVGIKIVSAINQISSQEIDLRERHAISIGCFKAREALNVIPEYCVIKGTVRSLKNQIGEKIINRIDEISQSCCALGGCKAENKYLKIGNWTTNPPEQTKFVEGIINSHFNLRTDDLSVMASEDFSYFLDAIPGCFFMVGVKDENHQEYLHTDKYDFNDLALPYEVEMFIRIIERKAGINLI